ncbi:signal transducer and activator of transcription 2 isoform X2 [Sebastes fasciatus]|uniref:signal transducer and activator of transcription 2 isoform X2 n=1 Tax=Sebastes fasciatus TaxID=394691 RepID=UPI003D9FB112
MAQWDRLRQLPAAYTQQLHELYDRDALPMDVRHYLSAWIEKQEWQRAARDHDLARVLFQVLLENLDIQHSRFVQEEAFLLQHNIRRYKQNFQRYLDEPCVLANTILWFLGKEKEILDNADLPKQVQCLHVEHEAMETSSQQDLERKLAGLRNEVQCMEHTLICLEEQQDEFDFKYQTHKMEAAVDEAQRKEQQKVFQLLINRLDECRKSTLADLNKILDRIDELIDILVKKELVEWQRRQQKACIGAPDNVCLDQLEKWFTCVAVCLFQVREFLGKLEELAGKVTYANDPVKAQRPAMQRRADTLLKDLLRSSLVVETQPSMPQGKGPLVLRTNVQFSVKTRLLVKFPELNHSMKVNVSMDREAPQIKGYRRFNVLGTNSKALNMAESQSGGMVADFRHLTLKEQKSGGGGKGVSDISLSVTEELHIICFDTVFELKGVSVELQASSIPVIIISNSSQQQSAWASVLWFNLLSTDIKDVAFLANSPASTWPQFGEMLSWQFLSATKRGLNEAQLEMIAHRLFGRQKNYDTCKVAWSKFSKENAPDTFWVWFDGILVMVKTYLEDLWRDGLIMGFVSKAKEKSLLTKKQRGTFLLRFSDSIIGGITFSWVEITLNGKPDVKTVTPFTKVDLCQIPFHEIIRNFQILEAENIPENPLIYLYPNTPKEDAFRKYYNEKSGNDSPYIKYIKTKLMFVSKENKLEAMSPMSSDMGQGEGLEPMNGLYGEAAEQDGSPPLQSPLETHHPDPMQSGTHHPDPMQSGTHHPDPMQSGTHHPDPMQSGTHHPDPMQSGTHHPDPMQSGTHHPDPMQSGTHHPDPMQSGTHHPDPMQSGTHHPDPMQSGTHHPDPMISGFGLNTEDDLLMYLNNPNTFTDSGIFQDEPELPDFSLQGFNGLPQQPCGSIFQ